MANIESAMKINVYDFKSKSITNEIVTCLKDSNGRILSLGNDMKRPEVTEHLAQHPEIQLTFPIENNKIVDNNTALAMFKYYTLPSSYTAWRTSPCVRTSRRCGRP